VFEINDLVAKVDVMLARLIGEDVRLITTLHPDAGNIRADPGRIEQVLMNLAVNARDAMPSGGTLAIETQSCFLDVSFVRQHPEVRPGEYVKLVVSDTGIGMETAVLSHIFEPFFTTKPVGKGTGLGLPMAYGIVKQSEGYIYCDSEPGKGSTFSIYLPRVRDEAAREASFVPASFRMGGNETIMLVEDDAGVRGFTRTLLRKHGYDVIEAASAEEALSAAAKHRGRIHLLVTDVVMPRMSGLELAPAIRKACPGIKVLYVSGYASGFAESSTPLGVELQLGSSFLQKPFTSERLLWSVRETLNGP
jgi:CheY-like chemotaxis protein